MNAAAKDAPLVLIVGNPNAGKTTLFNHITDSRAKVGNYPGVTVERIEASVSLPDIGDVRVTDLPGAYSVSAASPEEQIAVDALVAPGDDHASAVLVVVDATALARGLYLVSQLLSFGLPTVVALSMMDEARDRGVEIDAIQLATDLGVPVIPVVAPKNEGIDELKQALATALLEGRPAKPPKLNLSTTTESTLSELATWLVENNVLPGLGDEACAARAYAEWALLSIGDDELTHVDEGLRAMVGRLRTELGGDPDLDLVSARYALVDEWVERGVRLRDDSATTTSWTERLDKVLTHRVAGVLVFALVMALVFEALFAWSDPLIGVIENLVGGAQAWARATIPEGPLQGLVVDGIIAGVGNTVVFVPQIGLLFLFITFLEDSGYLARVAFVIDRLMGGVGLHGKAFVPMLSGFACAVPAVMATRTIERFRDRLLTMLSLPLMSCSARLPVYVLTTAAIFAPDSTVGPFSTGAVVLLAMYTLSTVAALGAAAVMRRTVLKGPRPTLVMELPPYRVPQVSNMLRATGERIKRFLIDAGTIILAMTIVLWALLSYPKDENITQTYQRQIADVAQTVPADLVEDRTSELQAAESGAQLRVSAAGRLGRAIEPALEPLGFDWRVGIAIIGSFAAREVFVSTLGVVFGIAEADEESTPLREALRSATWPDGRPLMTPIAGISLMVFFVLACQCMSTLAAVKRESGSWRWTTFLFVYMTVLAYVSSLLVFQVGTWLGWGTSASG